MKMQMKNYMFGPTRQWCVYLKNSFMYIYPTEKVAKISVFFIEAQNFIRNFSVTSLPTVKFH